MAATLEGPNGKEARPKGKRGRTKDQGFLKDDFVAS